MPLRVLLADESSTIKKVFQLTLQDYAVEVKSVNVGVDVKMVAQQFKPDIIFADILLQQKSGYDVSAEMKGDKDFLRTPIVLMWSGFMDIDEDKFLASRADAKLEKPFEVEKLRGLVNQLVPKTKSQNISNFLTFPKLPEFDEAKKKGPPPLTRAATPSPSAGLPMPPAFTLQPVVAPAPPPSAAAEDSDGDWDMEQFAKIEEFTPVDATEQFSSVNLSDKMPKRQAKATPSDADILADDPDDKSEWVQNQIENFRLNIPVDDNANADDDEMLVDNVIHEKALAQHIQQKPTAPTLANDDGDLEIDEPTPSKPPVRHQASTGPSIPMLSEEQLAEIIKAQSKEIIEKVVWRVVPEIATQIIERELKRLLDEKGL